MSPTLSIILPTSNRAPLLERALASIRQTTRCDYELIIVDGASTDATQDVLAKAKDWFGDRLAVIHEPVRRGFTKAANEGFRAARGTYVTWLNDDARPVGHSLDAAVQQLASAPNDVGLLALFHRCQATRSVAYTTTRHGAEFKLMHVRGTLYANFGLGRRELFERLDYFDERFIARGADPDFSLKVWSAGLRVVPACQSLIDHDETEDDRRAEDTPTGHADNERLFAKWDLPPRNPTANDFDPTNPCTLRGLHGSDAPTLRTTPSSAAHAAA